MARPPGGQAVSRWCNGRRAHGHNEYGPRYHDAIIDRVRAAVEHCDSIQCFLLLHSLGGGTGSGLGTYVLGALEPEFPDVFRFCVCTCAARCHRYPHLCRARAAMGIGLR